MEVEDALKAILLDIEGYLAIQSQVDPRSELIQDLRRYLSYVLAAGYCKGADDALEEGCK